MAQKLDYRIGAGLKDVIGKEPIAEAHAAVFELVKNSYDAHATRVDIVFQNIKTADDQNHSKILIVDDGNGMSHSDITDKWLFVGHSEKKGRRMAGGNFRTKPAGKNRMVAGSKGTGRLSADRLGRKLILYTKTRSDPRVHQVRMDRGRFENNQNQEFQSVEAEYDTRGKFPGAAARDLAHGTVLEIFPLSDKWEKEQLLQLKKHLQRMISPAQMPNGETFEIRMTADEFLASDKKSAESGRAHEAVNGRVSNAAFEKMGIKTTQVTCAITDSKIATEIVDKGRLVFRTEEANGYRERLHGISIAVFYLNQEAKNAFTQVMGMRPAEFGSVFLYRNGFRIHPYGEEGDDWLGLERRKGRGYSRRLAMGDLMGRVEINRNQSGFCEASGGHGGVVETEEYLQLLRFMQTRVVGWLERYVVEGPDWDGPEDMPRRSDEEAAERSVGALAWFTNQIRDPNKLVAISDDFAAIMDEKRAGDLPEAIKNLYALASLEKSEDKKAILTKELKRVEAVSKTREAEAAAKTEALESMRKQVLFLQKSQSKDAKLVEDYNHWIGISTGTIKSRLKKLMAAIRNQEGAELLMDLVESISKENLKIQRASDIVTQANFDTQTKGTKADIIAYIMQYINNVVSEWTDGIKFTYRNQDAEFRMAFKPIEVSILIDNFISNARKAGGDSIVMEFSADRQVMRMLIADNGRGVADENRESLFERGFTTTGGSGMGLGHMRTIVESMGGSIRFLGNGACGLGNGACFEVVIAASE